MTAAYPEALVRGIVHEIVHASHRAPAPRARRGAGTVTSAEESGITEEAGTRATENEIMAEIASSQGWTLTPTPTGAEEVRADLRSGLPRLTYQEFFIVNEMKNRNRVPGLDEASAVSAARDMVGTHAVGYVGQESVAGFTFTANTVQSERRLAAQTPIAPLGIEEALECARQGQSNRPPANPSAGCQELLSIIRGEGPLSYERTERRAQMHDILRRWTQQRYQHQVAIHEASSRFIRWYDSLPPELRTRQGNRALSFFQWVFIAESMSSEWQNAGLVSSDIRRRHLDFLSTMIGRDLSGISRPSSPE